MVKRELEKMHVSNNQMHAIFGEDFVSHDQRTVVMEYFANAEKAR